MIALHFFRGRTMRVARRWCERSTPASYLRAMTPRTREGFTLVELLVAVLLIDVGVLAMVAGTAVIVRRQNAMHLRAAAAQIAANRIQRLESGACATLRGTAGEHGINEQFSSDVIENGLRDLRDSVAFAIDGVSRAIVIRSRISC